MTTSPRWKEVGPYYGQRWSVLGDNHRVDDLVRPIHEWHRKEAGYDLVVEWDDNTELYHWEVCSTTVTGYEKSEHGAKCAATDALKSVIEARKEVSPLTGEAPEGSVAKRCGAALPARKMHRQQERS